MSPDDISKELGLSPDECFSPHSPTGMRDGAIVERGYSDMGIWSLNGESEAVIIPVQIEKLLIVLRPLREKLLRIKENGWHMRFFCGYFADDSTAGLSLPCNIMAEMGSLGIDFEISFYGHI